MVNPLPSGMLFGLSLVILLLLLHSLGCVVNYGLLITSMALYFNCIFVSMGPTYLVCVLGSCLNNCRSVR